MHFVFSSEPGVPQLISCDCGLPGRVVFPHPLILSEGSQGLLGGGEVYRLRLPTAHPAGSLPQQLRRSLNKSKTLKLEKWKHLKMTQTQIGKNLWALLCQWLFVGGGGQG